MTTFETYLVFNADNFCILFAFLSVLFGGILFIFAGGCDFSIEVLKEYPKLIISLGSASAVSLLLVAFIPSTTTAIAMYVVPKLTSPEMISSYKQNGKELMTLTKAFVDHYTKDK